MTGYGEIRERSMYEQPMQPAKCTGRYVEIDLIEAFGCCMLGYICGKAVRSCVIFAALTLLAYLSAMIIMSEHCQWGEQRQYEELLV